ncbi:MAG: hypothetical protein AAGA45_06720, partial [Verrucomicrobiota bacterium]
MTVRPYFFLLASVFTCLTAGAALKTGSSYADMVAELGQPQGTVQLADGTMYLYEAGEVRVEHGVVTSVKLKTPDEL